MNKTARVLIIAMALVIAFLTGYLPEQQNLKRCRQENAILANDLKRAVVRGIAVETELNLCKESKK